MYSDYYGLSGRPFQLTPDPRFWFESATHKKAMAYLGYGLAQGEGFVVVTGEIGAGKTTLVGHLAAAVDPARVAILNIASTHVGGDDLVRLVAQQLGIATEGLEKAQLLGRVEHALAERARAGQKALLIVDEAQSLGTDALEELRMLSNFQTNGQSLLQILLVGQPEFRDMLNSPGMEHLRQRVIATHHLTGMDADEVGPYIEHRLRLVDWRGNPQFSKEAYATLHHVSGGLPRKLNMVVTRALLLGAIEKTGIIDDRIVEAVLADMDREAPDADPVHQPAAAMTDAATLDLAARVAMLEAQSAEQDAALRRVLTLMVDWVESENATRLQASLTRMPA